MRPDSPGPDREGAALSLLVLIIVLLVALAVLAAGGLAVLQQAARGLVLAGLVPAACLVLIASLALLAAGASPSSLALPLGPPGLSAVLAIDGVGLAVLPLVAIAIAIASLVAEPEEAGAIAFLYAAALLSILAGDGFLLALGIAGALMATTGTARRPGQAGRWTLPILPLIALSLLASLACLAPHRGLLQGDIFPDLRAARLDGGSGWSEFALPAMLLLGLVPICLLLATGLGGARSGRAGVGVGAMRVAASAILPTLGLYLLARLLFDLAGPATPLSWGLVVMTLGLVCAIASAARAATAASIDAVLSAAGAAGSFAAMAAMGLALTARATDLAPLAAVSLGGALLLVTAGGLARMLAALVAEKVASQAGSARLAALGGLAGPMPRSAAVVGVAAYALAFMPPGAAFSALWLIVETFLASPRFGALGVPMVLALALASLAIVVALVTVAMLRLGIVAFLGRPRTPRGAAASEVGRQTLRAMGVVLAALLVVSLVPGVWLRLLAPVLRALVGVDLDDRVGAFALRAVPGSVAFSPLLVTLLVAGVLLAIVVARRRLAPGSLVRETPAWDGGAAPPPDWLPFGEPLAQAAAPTLARPILAAYGIEPAHAMPGEGPRAHRLRAPDPVPFLPRIEAIALRMARRLARNDGWVHGLGGLAPAILALLALGALVVPLLGAGIRP